MKEFIDTEDARKDRILEAALIEFSTKGYKKASTNSIVKEANVSKGLLFHYYKSKKDLYILLFKLAVDKIDEETLSKVDFNNKDVLFRLEEAIQNKFLVYDNKDLYIQLIENNSTIKDKDIINETKEYIVTKSKVVFDRLFSDFDYYQFKDEVNIEQSLQVIKWTIDSISAEWKNSNSNTNKKYNELVTEIKAYLNFFRNVFYK
jgi:AcrR family transcriptional regulator